MWPIIGDCLTDPGFLGGISSAHGSQCSWFWRWSRFEVRLAGVFKIFVSCQSLLESQFKTFQV